MVHRMEKMYIIERALCDDAKGRSQLIVEHDTCVSACVLCAHMAQSVKEIS